MEKPTINVLIIDDSHEEHTLYREYLNDDPLHSYRFLDAYSGTEGEAMYKENTIDCVILDYRLPDIDGLEVLKRLAQGDNIVPAVMLTGEGSETVAVIAMKTGSQDYIPKRVITPQALKRTIERAVERTRLMQRMEATRADLERSNQDLERFANVVAHDLKSPLRAIAQHLEIVARQTQGVLDEKSLKSIGFAVTGAERMRALIDGLFEFSRAGFEKHPFALTDCNAVLENVKSNLATHIAEKGAEITSDPLPVLMADSMQVMQLLQNLIANALKFCKDTPRIHIGAIRQGGSWAISVRDNGIGIPKASQDKIFTIFKRLHSEDEYEGCGIGLAVCDRVAKNHGGSISVISEPGNGSTFTVTLPVVETPAQEKAA